MLSGASNFVAEVDTLFLVILGISFAMLVLITTLMIVFVIKYNHKRHKEPQDIHGNALLEITWTVIPTILVLGMFYYGWISYRSMKNAPEDAMTIKVTGRMWSWQFEYPNGVKTDTLVVPLGKPVKLELASQDVIHSFFIPAFRIKQDVVPGLNTSVWFEARELGDFDILCAEYCGLQHSYMLSIARVVPVEEYVQWFKGEWKTATPASAAGAEARKLLEVNGCIACHSTDGTKSVGPTFLGMFGRQVTVVADGQEQVVTADETYLREAILQPEKVITKGYEPLMPPAENLSEEDLAKIIAYLKTLQN